MCIWCPVFCTNGFPRFVNKHKTQRLWLFEDVLESKGIRVVEILVVSRTVSKIARSSLSSLTNKMSSIESLYDCVDDLLQLPHVQQAMSQECQQKWVDNLLDACATTKYVLVNKKQNLENLLSAIRRRRDTYDISGYLTSRRKAEKIIHESLKALRSIKNKENVVILENHETVAFVIMLKEVESITLDMIESMLQYINQQLQQPCCKSYIYAIWSEGVPNLDSIHNYAEHRSRLSLEFEENKMKIRKSVEKWPDPKQNKTKWEDGRQLVSVC